ERRMRDLGFIELPTPFDGEGRGCFELFKGRDRRLEVAGIGKAVGTDRSAVGQGEFGAVILAQITADRAVDQFDLELHTARDHADLAGSELDPAELGEEPQGAVL